MSQTCGVKPEKKKLADKDDNAVEKRRRQNRESQRRYRERHRPKISKQNALYEAVQAHLTFSVSPPPPPPPPPYWQQPAGSPLPLATELLTSAPDAYSDAASMDQCIDPCLFPQEPTVASSSSSLVEPAIGWPPELLYLQPDASETSDAGLLDMSAYDPTLALPSGSNPLGLGTPHTDDESVLGDEPRRMQHHSEVPSVVLERVPSTHSHSSAAQSIFVAGGPHSGIDSSQGSPVWSVADDTFMPTPDSSFSSATSSASSTSSSCPFSSASTSTSAAPTRLSPRSHPSPGPSFSSLESAIAGSRSTVTAGARVGSKAGVGAGAGAGVRARPSPPTVAATTPTPTPKPAGGTPAAATGSKAEEMIRDVQDLYDLGVKAGFLDEDPRLRDGLEAMRRRFRRAAAVSVCTRSSSSPSSSDGRERRTTGMSTRMIVGDEDEDRE